MIIATTIIIVSILFLFVNEAGVEPALSVLQTGALPLELFVLLFIDAWYIIFQYIFFDDGQ